VLAGFREAGKIILIAIADVAGPSVDLVQPITAASRPMAVQERPRLYGGVLVILGQALLVVGDGTIARRIVQENTCAGIDVAVIPPDDRRSIARWRCSVGGKHLGCDRPYR